jgi:hypothetical protein
MPCELGDCRKLSKVRKNNKGKKMSEYSMEFSPIVARPSFLSGMGSLFDWAGAMNKYNKFPSPEIADTYAIYYDISIVGKDIYRALTYVGGEKNDKEIQKK